MTGFGHRILSVSADPVTRTLALVWDDGSITTKAMAALVETRRAFKVLSDPDLFTRVQVTNKGRAVAWNDDIDLCADALWLDAHPEQNPFVHYTAAAE